ncbi:MAG: prepilin peptidase [Deltaproteobacteria bacterium]|nr:prepilin peptidase [Deltaproteobacteria bacterium]MBL7204711.1 prepilin peptidase [Desulfobacteraceae bacterium]
MFLAGILVMAAINDLWRQKIPNLLTFPTICVGLCYHSVINGLDGLLFSAGGLALGIGLFILPYFMGGMGAGDAKLMGAVGAIVGAKGVFIAFVFTAIAGGVYAVILLLINWRYSLRFLARHKTTIKTFLRTAQFIPIPSAESEKKPRLCYGVAIAAGTFGYIFSQLWGYNFLNP